MQTVLNYTINLRATSKLNRRLTAGSIQFWAVVIV